MTVTHAKLVRCRSRKKLDEYLDSLPQDAECRQEQDQVVYDGDRAWQVTWFIGDKPIIRTIVKVNRSKGVVFIPENAC